VAVVFVVEVAVAGAGMTGGVVVADGVTGGVEPKGVPTTTARCVEAMFPFESCAV
jgi:hypothetical protein